MPDTYITAEVLGQRRNAAEYVQWFETKHLEIGQTLGGRRAYRNRLGLLKEFVTEALPTSLACEHYFGLSELVHITHIVGTQNHDAVVEDGREHSSGLRYLEVTMASETRDSAYRTRYLNEHGSVPLHSDLDITRNRLECTETIKVGDSEMVEHGAFCSGVLDRILTVAASKGRKLYPENSGLIIGFDPGLAFRDKLDLEMLDNFVIKHVLPEVTNFRSVFVSGGVGGVFQEYEVPM